MTAILMKSLFSLISRWRARGPAATSAKTSSGVHVLVRRLITFGELAVGLLDTRYVRIWIEAVQLVLVVWASDDGM